MNPVTVPKFDYEAFVHDYQPSDFVEYPSSATPKDWERCKREAGKTYGLSMVKVPDLPGVTLYTFGIDHENNDWIRYFLFSDGRGFARDGQEPEWGDIAVFSWDPAKVLNNAIAEEVEEILRDHILGRFRSEINDQLGDAAMIPEEDTDTDLCFTTGSAKELEKLTRLIVYSFPEIEDYGEDGIRAFFQAQGDNTNTDSSFLGLSHEDYLDEENDWPVQYFQLSASVSDRLIELLEFAARQNHMVGELLEYNDGAYNRMSGYDWRAREFEVIITAPSMHEVAGARMALRDLLAQNLSPSDINRLLPLE